MKKTICSTLFVVTVAGAFIAGTLVNERSGADAAALAEAAPKRFVCPMHPQFVSNRPGACPACGMALVAETRSPGASPAPGRTPSSNPGTVIVSGEQRQLMGVRVAEVKRAPGSASLRLIGRVAAEEPRTFTMNAGIAGFVREVSPVTAGSLVRKGQVLATYSAPDAISAIQAFIVTLNAQDRLRQSGADESAQANPNASVFQQRLEKLQDLGISDFQIDEIRRTREIPATIRILAPADGIVLSCSISAGQKFDRGADWYRVADLGRVWVLADLFGLDAELVRPGLHATIKLPARSQSFDATVSAIPPQFDAHSKALNVRLEVDNPAYLLRPDMFVDVEVHVELPPSLSVPLDAVLDSGRRQTVFVERAEGVFEPREVRTGWRLDGRIEITDGLAPGERIATSGTFLLDSESRLKLARRGEPGE